MHGQSPDACSAASDCSTAFLIHASRDSVDGRQASIAAIMLTVIRTVICRCTLATERNPQHADDAGAAHEEGGADPIQAALPGQVVRQLIFGLLDDAVDGGDLLVSDHPLHASNDSTACSPSTHPPRSEERRVGKECRSRWS